MTNSSAYTNGEFGKVHYAKPGVENVPICRNGVYVETTRDPLKVTCQRCMAILVTRQGVDRVELIHAMRREGIQDATTAKVLGLTRERVRQLGGNIHEDESYQQTKIGLEQTQIEGFTKDVKSGEEPAVLSPRYKLGNPGVVLRTIRRLGLWEEYRKGKQARRYDQLKERLREFGEAWRKKNGTNEYRTCDLLGYDTSLYGLCVRSGYLVEWSRELGLVYLTGESRLARGTKDGEDWKVDESFERRRGV